MKITCLLHPIVKALHCLLFLAMTMHSNSIKYGYDAILTFDDTRILFYHTLQDVVRSKGITLLVLKSTFCLCSGLQNKMQIEQTKSKEIKSKK